MLMKIQQQGMKLVGLWSFKGRTFIELLHGLFVFSILISYLVSDVISIFNCEGELDCILDSAAFCVQIIIGLFSFLVLYFTGETYYKAINRLEELMYEFDSQKYTKRADRLTQIAVKICHGYFVVGMTQFCIMGVFTHRDCMKLNMGTSEVEKCNFGAGGWFPFDITKNPGFLAAYVYQMFSEGVVISCCLQPTYLWSSILFHMIAHLQMLQDKLAVVCEEETHTLREKALRSCIQHHHAILGFLEPFLDACNAILLIFVVFMPLILGTLSFLILKMCVTTIDIWSMGRCVLHLLGWTAALLGMCILGQTLWDSSVNVAHVAYNAPWYEESLHFKKMILLLILRANKPITLQTASVGNACFESFTKVVKTTYSFITLMYNTLVEAS